MRGGGEARGEVRYLGPFCDIFAKLAGLPNAGSAMFETTRALACMMTHFTMERNYSFSAICSNAAPAVMGSCDGGYSYIRYCTPYQHCKTVTTKMAGD
jgi:hypothetical protein